MKIKILNIDLYRRIILKFGHDAQTMKAIEELSEVIQALAKHKCYIRQGKLDDAAKELEHIAEEIADVQIMTEQLKIIFNISESVDKWIEKKHDRICELIGKQPLKVEQHRIIVIEADVSEEEIIGIKEQIAEIIPNAKVVEVK